jgi:hypothetical protein
MQISVCLHDGFVAVSIFSSSSVLGFPFWFALFVVALEIPVPRGFARVRYGVGAAIVLLWSASGALDLLMSLLLPGTPRRGDEI